MKRLLLIVLAALACGKKARHDESVPNGEQWIPRAAFERGEARVAEARVQPIPRFIPAGGRIAFDDVRVQHVFSPVTGRVTRVLAQLGQPVHPGTPLAAILSPDVGSAVADEVKARADLTAAAHEYRRQQELSEAHAGSTREFEAAQDNFHKAQAEYERAKKRLQLLHAGGVDAVTQEFILKSRIEGRVVGRAINPGVEVQGQFSGGTAVELFTIGRIDTVWLYADVSEQDLPLVAPGAAIKAQVLAWPGKIFEGRVEWVSPTLDPALRTARIRCTLPNPDGLLKPEMFASVVVARPPQDALAIPASAVVRIGGQPFVYAYDSERPDGRQVFRQRKVELPLRAALPQQSGPVQTEQLLVVQGREPEVVEVLSGLAVGEKVLVDGRAQRGDEPADVSLTREQAASGLVRVVTAGETSQREALTVGGRLSFDDLRVSHVFPPVGGRIRAVLAAPGQRVKAGDPLAVIDSPDLGAAWSDELKAKADLVASGHEVKRQREMFALHASAKRDLEAAEDNFRKAEAEYARAAQKAKLLQRATGGAVTQEFTLRSPIAGEVIARNASPGLEVPGAWSGAGNVPELFTVGSIDDLWLWADIYEADLRYVKPGAEVTLELPQAPGHVFRGRVDWISDALDPVLRTAKVRCVLLNWNRTLRPEMYEVVTVATPLRSALTVPREAVLRLGDASYVFVAGEPASDGSQPFHRRAVLADQDVPGTVVPVLSGIKPGERVAAQGSIFLVGN